MCIAIGVGTLSWLNSKFQWDKTGDTIFVSMPLKNGPSWDALPYTSPPPKNNPLGVFKWPLEVY